MLNRECASLTLKIVECEQGFYQDLISLNFQFGLMANGY